ncbi:MAG: hypothetical protein E7252_02070 [Lachnospira sp.]|nr:hypothetical protein [Lachnospira sp.]
MPLRPIDLNTLQRSFDVAAIKQHEDNRAAFAQVNAQGKVDKKAENMLKRVNQKDEASGNKEEKHDAKEKGKNEYVYLYSDKKDGEEDGVVIKKTTPKFDMKI